MEQHGLELLLLCFVRIYEVSVWPVSVIAMIWIFKEQIGGGIKALMEKSGDLVELKIPGGGSAKFKRPERVRLPPLPGIEEKS
jgi:hypothetical protein